jgi:hypothetical protein
MKHNSSIRYGLRPALIIAAISLAGPTIVSAQDQKPAEKSALSVKRGGRDPFKKYEPVIKAGKSNTKLDAPPIQVRIERYRAQKAAAAAAHVAPPKPTTALLLNEMQVTGIFRTPRGWAAMVEATPIRLSYVIYPGESFFDGQLVAIEENRLVFRRDLVMADGRREKSVEIKPLRQPSPVEAMTPTTAKAAPTSSAPEAPKPSGQEKQ